MTLLEQKVKNLPVEFHQEVADFIDSILAKYSFPGESKLKQDWAGTWSDLADEYTAIDLQKEALEMRLIE